MAQGQGLGDGAADGQAQHVGLLQAEAAEESRGVVGQVLDGVGGLAAGPGDPGVVEQDHRPAGGQPVGDQGIPVVHAAAEVLDEHQRRPGPGPELAVGVPDSSGLGEPGGRGDMRISWHGVPSFLTGAETDRYPQRTAAETDRYPNGPVICATWHSAWSPLIFIW